jgi:23S rRNA pseudouridine1911/1915/1917 synthase
MSDDSELIDSPIATTDEESEIEQFRWRLSKNLTRRIDQYLVDRVGHLSRAEVQRLIKDGLVKVNGKPTKASYHPRINDEVEMFAPPAPVSVLVPEPIPLDVIYEDEHFLALNKQKDLIVHPARGQWTGTLVNGLVYYGKKWSTSGGDWRPGILHRLDRNTTGIMLVAKSDEAHWRIARQFENRTIQKTYLAVIHGAPPLLGDVIDMPIGKDRYVREKQAVRKIEAGGKPAITKYEVRESFSHSPLPPEVGLGEGARRADMKKEAKFTLLRLTPKTGRTHQLRVHLAAIGCPIVGDTIYGGRVFADGDFKFDRQALHAFEITFVHPGTLQTMTLNAPLPPDIEELLLRLRGNAKTGT